VNLSYDVGPKTHSSCAKGEPMSVGGPVSIPFGSPTAGASPTEPMLILWPWLTHSSTARSGPDSATKSVL